MSKHSRVGKSQFGKNLVSIMAERSITIRQAAKVAGVGASTVESWRSGAMPEDLIAVKRLADHLGIGFTFLLTGEHETNKRPSITDVFDDGGIWFDGIAHITIRKLNPKR